VKDLRARGLVAAVTDGRLLLFTTQIWRFWRSENSGWLRSQVEFGRIRKVSSKTESFYLNIPWVLTRLECDDGQIVEFHSVGRRKVQQAQRLAKVLTERVSSLDGQADPSSA
jgi:hypothetical protein